MTSGVYQLTFPSGARYIGKSVDIPARWKQHTTALGKGKAAGPMQAEFALFGYPEGSILFECHPDHIDLVEAVFIARNLPELNTSRPADPFPGVDDMEEVFSLLSISTHEHIEKILEISDKYLKESGKVKTLEEEVRTLKIARTEREVNIEKDRKISNLRNDNATLTSRIKALQTMLAYHNKPWWQKIF